MDYMRLEWVNNPIWTNEMQLYVVRPAETKVISFPQVLSLTR